MQNLIDYLQNLIQLEESDIEFIQAQIKEKEFLGKEIILKEGQTATQIYFVKSGLLRSYHLQKGKEVNTYFACENQFITTYASFITQKPSLEYIEAIEPSSVYAFPFSLLEGLYQRDSKFEKLGRYIAEKNYLCILDRTMVMQTKTAKEKYLHFIANNHPDIVMRVPQQYVASFLGIAAESLSRVKKEMRVSEQIAQD